MKIPFALLAWTWISLCGVVTGQNTTYTVKPGDSLSKIARGQGCTVESLAKTNGIKLSAMIQPGQTLKIPGKSTNSASGVSHTIQPGDTFSSISRQYGVPVEALQAANPGLNPKNLQPGQKILLSGPSKTPTTKAVPAPEPAPTPQARDREKPAASAAHENPDAAPATTPTETPTGTEPKTSEEQIRTVVVESEMTFGEFAAKHGTNLQRLNELNGLDLTEATVLAKGSELYVPSQP